MVSGGLAPSGGLLFLQPMPTGIEYWFYGFFHTPCYQAYGSLRTIGADILEITEDHGISGWF